MNPVGQYLYYDLLSAQRRVAEEMEGGDKVGRDLANWETFPRTFTERRDHERNI